MAGIITPCRIRHLACDRVNHDKYQFGVGRLLALTAAVAVVTAVAVQFNRSQLAQAIGAVYLASLVVWLFMRGPTVYRNLADVRTRMQDMKRRRAALEKTLLESREHGVKLEGSTNFDSGES